MCAVTVAVGSASNVFAINKPRCYDRVRHHNEGFKYSGTYGYTSGLSYLKFYSGFWSNCMRSTGDNIFMFSEMNTKYCCKYLKRTITFFANGIGKTSIDFNLGESSSIGGTFSTSSKRQTITLRDDSTLNYYVDTYIPVLFNDGEENHVFYRVCEEKIKKVKGKKVPEYKIKDTVNYETTDWWK